MNTPSFTLHAGDAPLVVSLPHAGQSIPESLRSRFVERALEVEDTDWHLDRLYGFARELGASVLVPRDSRYVIDLNRPPEDAPMYPGVNNTELVPTRFFTGEPLYRDGMAPDAAEVARRIDAHWRPYHEALARRARAGARAPRACAALRRPQHQVASCRGSSKGGCRISTSEPPTARAARRRCATRSARCSRARTATRTSSTAASRAATSRATTAARRTASTRCSSRCAGAATWPTRPSRGAGTMAQGDAVRPLLRRLLETMLAWRPA